jgi:hypothetical protein
MAKTTYDPTGTWWQNLLAGYGQGYTTSNPIIHSLVDQNPNQAQTDAPLLNTDAGKTGAFLGYLTSGGPIFELGDLGRALLMQRMHGNPSLLDIKTGQVRGAL